MDDIYIKLAIKEAKKAYLKEEIPVGCVIVKDNQIISKGYNMRESKNNVLMHAEIIAIDKACRKLNSWRLDGCTIYITLEPCMMCMGTILESRIKRIVYGSKNNNEQMYVLNKGPEMICLDNKECSKILSDFFKNRREK